VVDADDFDVESLRALLRGETPPQEKPEAAGRKATAAPKKPPAGARAKTSTGKTTTGKAAPANAPRPKKRHKT
jgi:hypothetical protein